jgi:hypothetical protein
MTTTPHFEKTPIGDQALIPGCEARAIPPTRTSSTRRQAETAGPLFELDQAAEVAQLLPVPAADDRATRTCADCARPVSYNQPGRTCASCGRGPLHRACAYQHTCPTGDDR